VNEARIAAFLQANFPDVLAEIGRVLVGDGVRVLTTPNLAAWTNREMVLRGHSPHQSPLRAIDGTHAHVDQVTVAISPLRRGLRAVPAPARRAWPALCDTCMVQAVRAGRGGGGPCPS
jgi:hypothetical protein